MSTTENSEVGEETINQSAVISQEEIAADALAWITYDQSITEAAQRLTDQPIEVRSLVQREMPCPQWVPTQYHADQQAFVRHIELYAGHERVLIARSFTHPQGDIVPALISLDREPLANLLFGDSSNTPTQRILLQSRDWYGRAVSWSLKGFIQPLLLVEVFDPAFTQSYRP